MSENPYQPPAVSEVTAPVPVSSEAEIIRQQHLRHESSIKVMGTLYYLGGGVMLVGVIMGGEMAFNDESDAGIFLVLLGVMPVQFATGWGLRRLKPWAKVPAGILSGLGLLAFGLGTIISIYFLYLLFCKKGRMVLSPAYQGIIEQTPDMKYRTPMWNWIVLGIILILVVGGIAFFMKFAP